MPTADLAPVERRFVEQAIRRRRLFAVLSGVGIVVGLGLGLYYGLGGRSNPNVLQMVVVVLVLLNARSNLRQYRYARALEHLTEEQGT